MSEIVTDEQAMQWCREKGVSVNWIEMPGKVRLYFNGDMLMEGDTLQGAVAKVKMYSRVALPSQEKEEKNTTTPRDTQLAGFAELLSNELRGWELSMPDVKQIIARRAYDLAVHVLRTSLLQERAYDLTRKYAYPMAEIKRPDIEGYFNEGEMLKDVSDMTEWPEETK